MDKLNNIIQRIYLESKSKDVVLYEQSSIRIHESLKFLNITCQYLSQLDELEKLKPNDILLLLSINEEMVNHDDFYRKVGGMILKYPDNFIIINETNKTDFLDSLLHKSLISLGFKLSPQINHDDIFFILLYL